MFLLVPVCHVGAHPGEHQYGWQLAGAIHGDRSFANESLLSPTSSYVVCPSKMLGRFASMLSRRLFSSLQAFSFGAQFAREIRLHCRLFIFFHS